ADGNGVAGAIADGWQLGSSVGAEGPGAAVYAVIRRVVVGHAAAEQVVAPAGVAAGVRPVARLVDDLRHLVRRTLVHGYAGADHRGIARVDAAVGQISRAHAVPRGIARGVGEVVLLVEVLLFQVRQQQGEAGVVIDL